MMYFDVGLQGSFIRFWLINFFIAQNGIALAYVCSSVAKTMDAANTLLPVYNTYQLLFSGGSRTSRSGGRIPCSCATGGKRSS